jgi:hypothetical protein
MDTKDIEILLAGAFLGFLASLLATFTAPPLGAVLGKFKSGFVERNKASAVANYHTVLGLKLGKRDKYLYAIKSWGFIILGFISCTFSILAAQSFLLTNEPKPISLVGMFVAMSGVILLLTTERLFGTILTLSRL